AHSHVVPNIQAWLAMAAVAEGGLEQASQHARQSLDAYAHVFMIGDEAQMRATQYRERPDFLEALIAAAHVHTARGRVDRAAVVLSFAAKLQREHGYRLDPPLQAMVDDLYGACRARLDSAVFTGAWQVGQSIDVAELLSLSYQEARGQPQ